MPPEDAACSASHVRHAARSPTWTRGASGTGDSPPGVRLARGVAAEAPLDAFEVEEPRPPGAPFRVLRREHRRTPCGDAAPVPVVDRSGVVEHQVQAAA